MAKKFDIKNVSMVFLPFVPAHIEYFKDGRPILAKLKKRQLGYNLLLRNKRYQI